MSMDLIPMILFMVPDLRGKKMSEDKAHPRFPGSMVGTITSNV